MIIFVAFYSLMAFILYMYGIHHDTAVEARGGYVRNGVWSLRNQASYAAIGILWPIVAVYHVREYARSK